jgi:hypothetical protein
MMSTRNAISAILAIGFLVWPVVWCVSKETEARMENASRMAEACAQAGGAWSSGWNGYCEITK